jgi:CDGSH-type Zn-finger protein/uncharacterized Fe-S cluster protein YjdI
MKPAQSKNLVVSFDARKCIHARRCVLGLPDVFVPGAKGEWIFPDRASADEVTRVIDTCPSGALSYTRKDDGPEERLPRVNTARLWENGPVEIKGDLRIGDEPARKRAVLCRCGQSQNKPYCDNSHRSAGFVATGEREPDEDAVSLEIRDGALAITCNRDGPLGIQGNLELIAASGRRITAKQKVFMCRCGASENKPYCDGSHEKIGFEAD